MQRTLPTQSLAQQYHQFLGDLGQAICDKISTDEEADALKEMESKEYVLERIKEIIQSVYEQKNQQALVKLFHQNEQLKISIKEQENEITKLTQRLLLNRKSSSTPNDYQGASSEILKQNQDLKNQNWDLQKRLIEQDQQNKLRHKQFSQTLRIMEKQKQDTCSTLTNQLSSAIQGIKLWEQRYKSTYQAKITLQNALQQQVQRLLDQQIRNKELTQDKEKLQINIENLTKINKNLKSQIESQEDKILGLQQNKDSLQQKIITYQEEIKMLKKVNEELNFQKEKGNLSSGQTNQLLQNLRQVQEQQLRSQAQQKERRLFQLQKKVQKLKSSKNQLQVDYHQYKLNSEKRIFQLEQELSEGQITHEKEVRNIKQSFFKERQALIKSHQQAIKDIRESFSESYKREIQAIQQQVKHSDQKLTKQKVSLKELKGFMNEKQLHYNQTLRDVESKNQDLKAYIRQLEKTVREKSTTSNDYLKEYGLKVQVCEEQVQHYKKENEKLRNDLELIRKQLNQVNISLSNEKSKETSSMTQKKLSQYKRQDFEQYIKQISDLKQKILVSESQQKFLTKEVQSKAQTIEQLKASNQKLEQRNEKYRQNSSRTERELSQLRKQLTEVQTAHHKELEQLYKFNERRVENEKKQLTFHYEQLLKSREEKLNDYRNNTAVIEHQLIINNMRSTLESAREKNLNLQTKIQSLTLEIKQLKNELNLKEQKIENLKQQLNQSTKQLFISRQQKSQLEKNIRNKHKYNQMMFKEFKFEIDAYLRKELAEVREIGKAAIRAMNEMKTWWAEIKDKFSIQFYGHFSFYQSEVNNKINTIKSHYERQVVVSHKIQLQELQQDFQQKLKQRHIENLTEITSRQLAYKQLQKEANLMRIGKEKAQERVNFREEELKKSRQELKLLKQVNQKMNEKVTKSQKFIIQSQINISQLSKENSKLRTQIQQTQQAYQAKLDKCREKYAQQNEKLFVKYQKQFDKLITMNTKVKNSTLSSIMLSNIAPTKEFEDFSNNFKIQKTDYNQCTQQKRQLLPDKTQSKLDNIKKEILAQKKKLQSLDSTKNKIHLKATTSMQRIHRNK